MINKLLFSFSLPDPYPYPRHHYHRTAHVVDIRVDWIHHAATKKCYVRVMWGWCEVMWLMVMWGWCDGDVSVMKYGFTDEMINSLEKNFDFSKLSDTIFVDPFWPNQNDKKSFMGFFIFKQTKSRYIICRFLFICYRIWRKKILRDK